MSLSVSLPKYSVSPAVRDIDYHLVRCLDQIFMLTFGGITIEIFFMLNVIHLRSNVYFRPYGDWKNQTKCFISSRTLMFSCETLLNVIPSSHYNYCKLSMLASFCYQKLNAFILDYLTSSVPDKFDSREGNLQQALSSYLFVHCFNSAG